MNEVSLLQGSLMVGALLFGIGLIGFVSRRNMILMFLSAEMMLQGVSVSLVAWGRWHNDFGGQVLTIFILTVAACEAALALALILMLYRSTGRLDVAAWQALREASVPPYVDHELPELDDDETKTWPHLQSAGTEPTHSPTETVYRSHV